MKTFPHFIIPILSLMVAAFSGNAREAAASAKELKALVVENPDSVIMVLDDMEARDNGLPSYQINLIRSIAYNEKRMFSLVERYATEALKSDSIDSHGNEKINALSLLANARRFFGDFSGSIAASTEAMEMAHSLDNQPGELSILLNMAKTSFEMGNREDGYRYIDRIITSGGNSDNARVLANVSAAYGVKVIELYADNRFKEGLAEGQRRLQLIDKIDRAGGTPPGFVDQQRAYTFARIASCAEREGDKALAENAYRSFIATDYAGQPIGRAYIMDYLLDSGKWDEVLKTTRPLYPILQRGDTINDDYRSLLISDARAFAGLGRFREAYELSRRSADIKDSLSIRENTARTRELAAVFALEEKELELANARADLQKRHILMVSAAGVAFLLLIIVLLIMRAWSISRKQQKTAAARIDRLLAMNKIVPAVLDEESMMDTFVNMQQALLNSDLFSNPNFNRDSIAECSGLSRTKVINLIEKFTGLTPSDYINKLRVEHSVELIQQHPDWTIDAIAESCGYIRRATYYSHFSKFFGITPAQYRKEKSKSAE